MPANASKKWTPEEDALLRSLVEAGTRPLLVAAKLKRSVDAIRGRAQILGLLKGATRSPWTSRDDELLRKLATAGKSVSEMATALKRSPTAIRSRAYVLSIPVAASRNQGLGILKR
jgi:hypothetical protein